MAKPLDDDIQIQKDVLDELEFEPRVDAASIGVSVKDGVVILSGHTPTLVQKIAAEAAAKRVKGVRAVVQEIEVQLSTDQATSDEAIAARAADLLSWTVLPKGRRVHVTVEDGWVRLSGELEWRYQRDDAERAIRNLAGVKGVRNAIVLCPHLEPGQISKLIARAFHRDAELERANVKVEVEGSTVTLTGKVKTWYERELAERAAWSAPGVSAVVDNLRIG